MKKIIALCAFVLGVSLIILCALLMRQAFEQGDRMDNESKVPRMECTLTLDKNNAKVGDDPAGAVAIKNVSKETLVIDYIAAPFHHLDLQVFDPAGKKISVPYRAIYSITDKGQLTLRPGETYRSTVAIFASLGKGPWEIPGTYKITAIYEYNKERAVSKELELTLIPK